MLSLFLSSALSAYQSYDLPLQLFPPRVVAPLSKTYICDFNNVSKVLRTFKGVEESQIESSLKTIRRSNKHGFKAITFSIDNKSDDKYKTASRTAAGFMLRKVGNKIFVTTRSINSEMEVKAANMQHSWKHFLFWDWGHQYNQVSRAMSAQEVDKIYNVLAEKSQKDEVGLKYL